MREIKFRAWDKKQMIYFNVFNQSTDFMLNNYSGHNAIMQFTGLVDKNGKEIYEGDILSIIGGKCYVVTYSDGMHSAKGLNVGWYVQRGDFESFWELTYDDYNEVLGNIYENPELLKEHNLK